MKNVETPELRDAALAYLRERLSVIPIDVDTKRPRVQSWKQYQSRLPSEEDIVGWWQRWPDAAIAVVTGRFADLVVVDIDVDAPDALAEVQKVFGETTWHARTPRGAHLGYRHPGGRIRNATHIDSFGFPVDIRGDGGYVVMPPSPGYAWCSEAPRDQRPLFPGYHQQSTLPRPDSGPADPIPRGERNSTLASLGGTMRRRGMAPEAIAAALLADNKTRCNPPLDEREVRQVARSMASYAPPDPRPRLLTSDEFENDQVPEAIAGGMIYRASTHLLTGASKTGKSWLAYQATMALSAGVPFLGLTMTKSRVLLVSLEMSAAMVRTRMKEISRDLGLPMPSFADGFRIVAPTIDYLPTLDLGAESGIAYLKDLISEASAEIVFLDTLYRFTPGMDPLSNQEMAPLFGNLNDLAQTTGAALVALDHTAKGVQLGPVSQSGIGAQVKGGASRVIVGLKQVSRDDGGRWQIDVASHFGSWDDPIFYERPRLADGTRGSGCVPLGASRAFRLDLSVVRELFEKHGDRGQDGYLAFRSRRHLTDSLMKQSLASGNADAPAKIKAIERDFAASQGTDTTPERPIAVTRGKRKAWIYTWRETDSGGAQP